MKDYLRKLNDEEFDMVSGGKETETSKTEGYCSDCGKMVPVAIFNSGRYRCIICKSSIEDETTIHFIKD